MKNIAHLNNDSPFHAIFTNGVPTINCVAPNAAICEGDGGPQDVYMIDLDKLTLTELEATISLLITQRGFTGSREEAKLEIMAMGLPLRAKHVRSVTTDSPFFL